MTTLPGEGLRWLLCDYADLPNPIFKTRIDLSSKTAIDVPVAWPELRMALVVDAEHEAMLPKFKWNAARLPRTLLTNGAFLKDWTLELVRMLRDPNHRPDPSVSQEGQPGMVPAPTQKILLRLLAMEHPELVRPATTGDGHLHWDDVYLLTSPKDEGLPRNARHVWMPETRLASLSQTLKDINNLKFKAVVAAADNEAESNVSMSEGWLLDALTRVGLPAPERNHEFYWGNGELATIPDFVWQRPKFVLELDGYYFHKGLHLSEGLKAAVEQDPVRSGEVKRTAQDRAVKDAAKRRLLGEQGWVVYTVHDVEVRSTEAAMSIARQVKRMITVREQQIGLR